VCAGTLTVGRGSGSSAASSDAKERDGASRREERQWYESEERAYGRVLVCGVAVDVPARQWRQRRFSLLEPRDTAERQPRHSQETAERQPRDSRETAERQPRDSPAPAACPGLSRAARLDEGEEGVKVLRHLRSGSGTDLELERGRCFQGAV